MAIQSLTTALYLGSSAWYLGNGDRQTGTITGVVGLLQGVALVFS